MTNSTRTHTRTAAGRSTAAAARGPAGGDYPPVGATGRRVVQIAGVDVEVYATDVHDGDERVTCAAFPIRDQRPEQWAVVSLGQLDGSRWMVAFGGYGWQHDEWPSIVAAVEAVSDRKVRQQMLARTAHEHAVRKTEHELRMLHESQPEAPAGAVEPAGSAGIR